jgi:hypothetical protein
LPDTQERATRGAGSAGRAVSFCAEREARHLPDTKPTGRARVRKLSAEVANRPGVKPRARLRSFAVVGDRPIHRASGARIITTLLSVLEQTRGRYGLRTMREAGGLANAVTIKPL